MCRSWTVTHSYQKQQYGDLQNPIRLQQYAEQYEAIFANLLIAQLILMTIVEMMTVARTIKSIRNAVIINVYH